MTDNVKKCAVVVCNKDKVDPVALIERGEKMNYRSQTSIRTLA